MPDQWGTYTFATAALEKPAFMEDVLSALVALIFWRILLCTVGSIALALSLSNAIAPFTAEYSITLVILGVALGMYWQSRAEAAWTVTESIKAPKISRPVAFLGLAFIGLIVGGAFAELFSSKLFGAVSLVVGAASVAAWYRYAKHQSFSRGAFAFALSSLLAGYWVPLLLSLWGGS